MLQPKPHPVYKCLNKPLTILGVERGLFFLSTGIAAVSFNFFGSLLGALFLFLVLFAFASWATASDPQILRILLNSSKHRRQYDPAKRT